MVYRKVTEGGKHVQTEIGRKNPTIVTESADAEVAADIIAGADFGVTGQTCMACSRAIVTSEVYNEFLDAIVNRAEVIEVGSEDGYDMGPQESKSELEGTLEYIDVAKCKGSTLATGDGQLKGGRFSNGYYVEPTIFTEVDNKMRITHEEVFGPVLAVIEV